MGMLTDLIGGMGWMTTPLGIAAVVAITAVVLSGLPARLVLMISARMPR